MRYEFTVGRSCRVKTFLKEHDISKGLLAKIKFEGGHIWVNGEEQFATYPVHEGDVVAIEIPPFTYDTWKTSKNYIFRKKK